MSHYDLINKLLEDGVLKTKRIIEAFMEIDRADFVKKEYIGEAYGDYPLPTEQGQTISQPSTVAFMLELLQPAEGDRILDVGSGSGWSTALLAQIAGPKGRVWGVELIGELVKFGSENLAKYDFPHAGIQQAGDVLGLSQEAPFDKILVSAAGEEMPQALIDQLKVGGRLVVPIQDSSWKIDSVWKVDKVSETEIDKIEFPGFAFVPLK